MASTIITTHTKVSDIPEDLEHSGVKGMRWGVRKAEGGRTGPVGGGYKGPHNKSEKGKGPPRKMTEEELKATVARLKLEKEYKALTTKQKGESHKFLTKILVGTGTTLTGIIINHYLGDPLKGHLDAKKTAKAAKASKSGLKNLPLNPKYTLDPALLKVKP